MLFNWNIRSPELGDKAFSLEEHREFTSIPDETFRTKRASSYYILLTSSARGVMNSEFEGKRLYIDHTRLSDERALLFEEGLPHSLLRMIGR